jgi:hypothetical protein
MKDSLSPDNCMECCFEAIKPENHKINKAPETLLD